MSKKNQNEQQNVGKKSSKKPLVAILLAAVLALGGYGASQYLDNQEKPSVQKEEETKKETVNIRVTGTSVFVNGQEQKLADGQAWKALLTDFFGKKDLSKTNVVVDFDKGDYDVVKEIKDVLTELKITSTESKSAEK